MTERPRLVIDTNVLISRLLRKTSIAALAARLAMSRHQLLASDATLAELQSVLSRPKFDPYVSQRERQQFLAKLRRLSIPVQDIPTLRACRDPKDDTFLSLAVAGRARLILTGDKDLLVMNPFQTIDILSPRDYLERVGAFQP